MAAPVLEVKDLSIAFCQYQKGLRQTYNKMITNLSLDVNKGEIVAIVGSSGSGKSLLAHAILGILPDNCQTTGEMYYQGEILDKKRLLQLRGKEIALVPQSVSYLDPLMRAGKQVAITHRDKKTKATIANKLFTRFGLRSGVEQLFPFQLSGGMARRVLISAALAGEPKLLIADEPTPGLDEAGVKEALASFTELAELGHAIIMITHDLEAALQVANRIIVFYAGTTIEIANAADFTGDGSKLRHPYSRALWNALPQNSFEPVVGSQPLYDQLPSGCLYSPRCAQKSAICNNEMPKLQEVRCGKVRCLLAT